MRKLLKFTAIMLILAGAFACKKNENNSDVTTGLKGTKWKLEGIVNEQTGAMQVLEPIDCQLWPTLCKKCYTLEFDTDTVGTGWSTTNKMGVNLNQPPFLGTMTEVNEITDDGHFFVKVFYYIRTFEHQGNTLKFFFQYENINYYLLYKKHHDENNS
jgi:hypothetical protein